MLGWQQILSYHAVKHGEIRGRESHAFFDRSAAKTNINWWFQMFKLTNKTSWNIPRFMYYPFWPCGSIEAFKLENFVWLKMDGLNGMLPIQPTEQRPNLIWTFHEWCSLDSSCYPWFVTVVAHLDSHSQCTMLWLQDSLVCNSGSLPKFSVACHHARSHCCFLQLACV